MNRKLFSLKQDFTVINRLISEGFTSKSGPGDFPVDSRNKKIKGMLIPYWGYALAGSAMAWAYKEIAESEIADTYVILGQGDGIKTYLFGAWDTPFGPVNVNSGLGRKIVNKFPLLENNFEAFIEDKSIEMQLPFLQFANKQSLTKLKLLPILVGNTEYEEITGFADVLSELDGNICFICSANLTYYGKQFGHLPFVHGIKENLRIIDEQLIDFICNLDAKGFYKFANKNKLILDKDPIALFIEIMKGFGLKKGRLLSYYHSGEISGFDESVGLGAVAF